MNQILQAFFWVSALGLIYIFCGYPAIVWWRAAVSHRERVRDRAQRNVSVVIVAHNEALTLRAKIEGLLASTRLDSIAEIIIASDGSTDGTAATLSAIGDPRVRFIHFSSRRGKPAVLNDVIPRCKAEIVLLADARQEFAPDCVERLLDNFADGSVGVVSGELVLRGSPTSTTVSEGIGLYWRYEKFIRRCESDWRGVPGATGAGYAIRKSLFRPIPVETLLDDVAIPMQAAVLGYRCVFESSAYIFDEPSRSARQEHVRKRRTIAGVAQLARLYPSWLSPRQNPIWFEYVSHKLARLASPVLLGGVLMSNLALMALPVYRELMAGQVVFYVSALCGWMFQRIGYRSSVFGAPLMFVTLNLTTAWALWDAFRSNYRVTWDRAGDPRVRAHASQPKT